MKRDIVKPELCLGTAQFGMNYGITNHQGKVSVETTRAILEVAVSSGISYIDTAQAYGDSERILGSTMPLNHEFKIISKLSAQSLPGYQQGDMKYWERSFQASLERLGVKRLDSFLLHHPADLSKPGSEYLLEWLRSLQERQLVRRLGISAYDAWELSCIDPELIKVVQVPLSLYDQRMLRDGTIDKLHKQGISVHVRSSFMQGLLVTPAHRWPSWASQQSRNRQKELAHLAESKDCSLVDMALGFINCQEKVEAVVFGVCSLAELASFLEAWNSTNAWDGTEWKDWCLDDPLLLDPRQWPK